MRIQQQVEDLQSENSTLKEQVGKLEKQVHSLEKWQDHIVNWMRRVDSLLDTSIDAKWSCPNCKYEFENLSEYIEHIVANINDLMKQLNQHLEDKPE